MTRPTVVFFGPDGRRGDGEAPRLKVFLRTLLYSTARRGQTLESMHVNLRRAESTQNFSIWVYGDDRLARGSGLYVGHDGVACNHHFLLPEDDDTGGRLRRPCLSASASGRIGLSNVQCMSIAVCSVVPTRTVRSLARSFETLKLAERGLPSYSVRRMCCTRSITRWGPVSSDFGRFKESRAFVSLRNTLLSKLISGERRVNDDARFVARAV